MASERQLNANRRNAQLGGPKTEEGKAKTRLNALRHGLAAGHVILPHEDVEAFNELRNSLLHQYAPENKTEEIVVEEFARAVWQLERAHDSNADLFALELQTIKRGGRVSQEPDPAQDAAGIGVVLVSQPPQHFQNLFRYQAAIERSYYRALKAVKEITKDRESRRLADERLAIQRHKSGIDLKPAKAAAAGHAQSASSSGAEEARTDVSESGIGSVPQIEASAPIASSPLPLSGTIASEIVCGEQQEDLPCNENRRDMDEKYAA